MPDGLSPAPRKGSPCPSLVLSGAYAAGRILHKAKSALCTPRESSTQGHVPVAGTPSKGAGPLQARRKSGANPQTSWVAWVLFERDRRPALPEDSGRQVTGGGPQGPYATKYQKHRGRRCPKASSARTETSRRAKGPQSTKNTEERPKPAGEGRDSARKNGVDDPPCTEARQGSPDTTSREGRLPAKFKHIIKRRKRNQQGFP